jgi:hypothetical protein
LRKITAKLLVLFKCGLEFDRFAFKLSGWSLCDANSPGRVKIMFREVNDVLVTLTKKLEELRRYL